VVLERLGSNVTASPCLTAACTARYGSDSLAEGRCQCTRLQVGEVLREVSSHAISAVASLDTPLCPSRTWLSAIQHHHRSTSPPRISPPSTHRPATYLPTYLSNPQLTHRKLRSHLSHYLRPPPRPLLAQYIPVSECDQRSARVTRRVYPPSNDLRTYIHVRAYFSATASVPTRAYTPAWECLLAG
jgi:hypothetical protein